LRTESKATSTSWASKIFMTTVHHHLACCKNHSKDLTRTKYKLGVVSLCSWNNNKSWCSLRLHCQTGANNSLIKMIHLSWWAGTNEVWAFHLKKLWTTQELIRKWYLLRRPFKQSRSRKSLSWNQQATQLVSRLITVRMHFLYRSGDSASLMG
jgi:hypothetical protein